MLLARLIGSLMFGDESAPNSNNNNTNNSDNSTNNNDNNNDNNMVDDFLSEEDEQALMEDKRKDSALGLKLSRIVLLETTMPFLAAASISVTVNHIIIAASEGSSEGSNVELTLTVLYSIVFGYCLCKFVHYHSITNKAFAPILAKFSYFAPGSSEGAALPVTSNDVLTNPLSPATMLVDKFSSQVPSREGATESSSSSTSFRSISSSTKTLTLRSALMLWKPYHVSHRFLNHLAAENTGFALKDLCILLILEKSCAGCGFGVGIGFAIFVVMVVCILIFIAAADFCISKSLKLHQRKVERILDFDSDAFALPIAYTIVILVYFVWVPFESADITEEITTDQVDMMLDFMFLAFGIAPLLLAAFACKMEDDENEERETIQPEKIASETPRPETEAEDSFNSNLVDCFSTLFCNVLGYICGLGFFNYTQAVFFSLMGFTNLPSATNDFFASLALAVFMTWFLPSLTTTILVKKVALQQRKERITAASMSAARRSDKSGTGGASRDAVEATSAEVPPGPVETDSCAMLFFKRFMANRRTLLLSACQLVLGWTWEEAIIGALDLIISNSAAEIIVDILVTTLIIIVSARVQYFLDETAAERAKEYREVQAKIALRKHYQRQASPYKVDGPLSFVYVICLVIVQILTFPFIWLARRQQQPARNSPAPGQV